MGPNDSEGGPLPVVTPTDVPLQMTASVPDEPIKITGPFLQIDTQLTNITDSLLELRTARAGADISVVKDGVVLRPPGRKRDASIRFTLAPGASWVYKSTINLGYPDPASFSAIHPLAPGTHELYAVQRFTPVSAHVLDTRRAFDVHGGPWDVQIGWT
jgi:hypothetical protein